MTVSKEQEELNKEIEQSLLLFRTWLVKRCDFIEEDLARAIETIRGGIVSSVAERCWLKTSDYRGENVEWMPVKPIEVERK